MFVKRIIFALGVLALSVAFISYPTQSVEASCVASQVPMIASSGGDLKGDGEDVLALDGRTLLLGGEGAWVVLDFGCFSDNVGDDLRIFEIGDAEGGEVYVGRSGASLNDPSAIGVPRGDAWVYIKPAIPPHSPYNQTDGIFECDGTETLPDSGVGCSTGEGWLSLDIGNDDGAEYRYVYIWSNGSENVEGDGADSDIDTVEVIAPQAYVDLQVRGRGGTFAQFYSGVLSNEASGSLVEFTAFLPDDTSDGARYEFYCNANKLEPSKTGEVGAVGAGAKVDLLCTYSSAGGYDARVILVDGERELSDSAHVNIMNDGDSAGVLVERLRDNSKLKQFLLIIIAICLWVLYELFVKMHKRKEERGENKSETKIDTQN